MAYDDGRCRGSMQSLLTERQGLMRLMQNEGYDLSKFALVSVPEEFSDASGTDQIGHCGLLEYDGVLDVEEDSDSEGSHMSGIHAGDEFNVTIEHVPHDLGQGSAGIHLLDIVEHHDSTRQFCEQDILDIGIEANDLNSLLEQFEECEKPKKQVDANLTLVQQPQKENLEKITKQEKAAKQLPNPADVVKKIAPVKRKAAILLETEALPFKRTKAKPTASIPNPNTNRVTPNAEVKHLTRNSEINQAAQSTGFSKPAPSAEIIKAISLARSDSSSPIPFNLKTLIPIPKYLSMEHDYCLSPASSEKSNTSDLGFPMSKEERRAYYKNKYKVKKRTLAFDSPAKGSSVSSSPASMSSMGGSPVPGGSENGDSEKAPFVNVPCPEPVPLFDKIPDYFPKKLLVGMYREIDNNNPERTVHQGFDQRIFVTNNNAEVTEKRDVLPASERKSRQRTRRRRHLSLRKSQTRRNSLSSQSDSSYCSSCSGHSYRENGRHNSPPNPGNRSWRPRQRKTRDSVHTAASRSRSRSRSTSRSISCSSYSSYDSRGRSRSGNGSYSRSRSRSYSRSRSRSYSRSRSRSFSRSLSGSRSRSRSYSRSRSRSQSRSQSRSRSRSKSRDYPRRSRSYSRSLSRSPPRIPSRNSRSRARSRSQAQSRSNRHGTRDRDSKKINSSCYRTFDPNSGTNEVKYTDEQLQEFDERRVVYVGNIDPETTKRDLLRQFSKFGSVDKVALHFREDQDSYGFVTFRYKCDAVAAIAGGNDPNGPQYDLCFGGRRKFCITKYEDLDSLNKASEDLDFGYNGEKGNKNPEEKEESEFDKLLKAAMKGKTR